MPGGYNQKDLLMVFRGLGMLLILLSVTSPLACWAISESVQIYILPQDVDTIYFVELGREIY